MVKLQSPFCPSILGVVGDEVVPKTVVVFI